MSTGNTDFFGGLKGIREIPAEVERQAVKLSDDQGFTLRQPMREPPKRKRGTALQLHNFTMRLHMDDMDRFIRWCEQEKLAYREGFQRLVGSISPDISDERRPG